MLYKSKNRQRDHHLLMVSLEFGCSKPHLSIAMYATHVDLHYISTWHKTKTIHASLITYVKNEQMLIAIIYLYATSGF